MRWIALFLLWLPVALVAAGAAHATLLYDVTFDSDPSGPPVLEDGPFPRSHLSSVVYGVPSVVAEVGPMAHALAFDWTDRSLQQEQVAFDVAAAGSSAEGRPRGYRLDLDVLVESLGGTPLRPPASRSCSIRPTLTI